MSENCKNKKFIVIGQPRAGFTLLISILNNLYNMNNMQKDEVQQTVNHFIPLAGELVHKTMLNYLKEYISLDDVFYSGEFSLLVGGPKWIDPDDHNTVCIRKYFGVKGLGDFTFIQYLPKYVLDYYEVVHSHYYPIAWMKDPYYKGYEKLASMRNPIDTMHSAVHSINALTSEYIIRRMPDADVDYIREELALYKLTDLNFLEGLITPQLTYLKDFVKIKDQFLYIMRWEDLITQPIKTILEVAKSVEIDLSENKAVQIWKDIDHRNLTVAHRHNFRKGVLGDWKNKITNSHLEIFKKHGFGEFLEEFGYGKIEYFDEKEYTPTQKLIEEHIKKGQPYKYNLDETLFTFAFQKSNFISSRFQFKTDFPRVGGIKIERSTFKDEKLLEGFTDEMGKTVATITDFLNDIRNIKLNRQQGETRAFGELEEKYHKIFSRELSSEEIKTYKESFESLKQNVVPVLLESRKSYNIVRIGDRVYGVPQSLGPMELDKQNINSIPEILVGETTKEVRDLIDT